MTFHDWINDIRWKYFTNNKSGLIFKELTKEFRIVEQMTENKRFVMYEHKDNNYILDSPNTSLDFIEMLGDALSSEEIVDLLNEQEEEIQRLKKELKNRKKMNNILEGFLLDKGYDFNDILKFLQDRTEKGKEND